MTTVRPVEPELISVGPDEVVVTFTTPAAQSLTTRAGDHEVTTTGPRHVAHLTGLEPDTAYPLAVEGAPPARFLPADHR